MKSADADMRHADLQACRDHIAAGAPMAAVPAKGCEKGVASPRASVQPAKDVLCVIDQRAGHRLRGVGKKKQREPRDVVRGQQPTERHARGGFGEPAFAFAERDRLHMPLGRGVDPAENDAIDANAVETMGAAPRSWSARPTPTS